MAFSWLRKINFLSVDIALVICPAWGVSHPPIGIGSLEAFLIQNKIKVKCFDFNLETYKLFTEKKYWDLNFPDHFFNLEPFKQDVLPTLEPLLNNWAKSILACHPKVVGFSLFMSNVNASVLLARELKKINPKIIIVGGGAEVSRLKKIIVELGRGLAFINKEVIAEFDLFVEGEGELTLTELVSLIKKNKDFYNIDGIYYLKKGKFIVNNPRKIILNEDILPAMDFASFPLKNYTVGVMPIITSRGCINRCAFCTDSPLWKVYRQKSASKVVEGIIYLTKKYELKNLEMLDSIFNADIPRLRTICEMIIQKRKNIFWSAKVTARKEMTPELLKLMKMSGCTDLSYGVESGSERVLTDMRKNNNLAEVEKIIRDTALAGINAHCFFIVGYPTETEEDFQQTLNFIKRNFQFIHRFEQVTGCHIEEDSYLGHNLDKYGIIYKHDGWHSQESTPEIRAERLNRFKALARQLHKDYKCETQL